MGLVFIFLSILFVPVNGFWTYPDQGFATMTHYSLPLDYVASCGCVGGSTHYPTAALSQLAFGSTTAYGPSCGRCFNLTLLNTFLSEPPFFPPSTVSIVIKVTDLCPSYSDWCQATADKPNQAGNFLNFDLAFPSPAIPDNFFPSNETEYGYTDFGVWNISYALIPCTSNWAGSSDSKALGSVPSLNTSGCCPADPVKNPNSTCPSYSESNDIPPDTAGSSSGVSLFGKIPFGVVIYPFVILLGLSLLLL